MIYSSMTDTAVKFCHIRRIEPFMSQNVTNISSNIRRLEHFYLFRFPQPVILWFDTLYGDKPKRIFYHYI